MSRSPRARQLIHGAPRVGLTWMAVLGAGLWLGGAAGMRDTGADDPAISAIDRTIAEVGRSRVIAFTLATPAEADLDPAVSVEPQGVLEILSPARVLAGEAIGYVRVRGVGAGAASLHVGSATIGIEVVPPRVPGERTDRPLIVAPSAGAAVWGVVSVGVERTVEPREEEGSLRLELPDGRLLEPVRVSDAAMGPDRRAVFEVDAAALPDGACTLTPLTILGDGSAERGEPITVRVAHPDAAALTQGEAEARYDVQRPRRFQDGRANVGRNDEASGGAYFNNFGSYPAVCFPVKVERAGWYQVCIRAMGTLAGGELPWVDVVVDGAEGAATGGPLVSMRWHRVALGTPIWLEAGTRLITPFFANDFYVQGAADRNLMIDTIEVARVGASDSDAGQELASLDDLAGDQAANGEGAAMPASRTRMMMGAMGGASAMPGASGMVNAADPMGVESVPVRIALDRVLDGTTLTGDLLVEGQAWTPQERGQASIVPEVALLVSGHEVGRQRTFAPRFLLDADEFEDGANTIQLVATIDPSGDGAQGDRHAGSAMSGPAGGAVNGAMAAAMSGAIASGEIERSVIAASTPLQTVTFHRPPGQARGQITRTLRFGIHDRGWDDHTRELLKNERYPRERVAAAMYSQETVRLTLPEELTGRFRVGVEALGTAFEGPPVLAIRMESAREGPAEIGQVNVATWWDTRFVEGAVDLPPGPKSMLVTFTNDKYEAGAGDRNVWMQSLVLMEARGEEDETVDQVGPLARMLYPRDGDEFCMQGGVVAEACDDTGVERIELVVDGWETGVRRWVRRQSGPFVLPLLCRSLDPGEHTVSVRAYDAQGNVSESSPASVRVLGEPPEGGTEYDRAITLLDRFAFGPDDRELTAILTMGSRAWLEDRLSRSLDEAGEITAMAPGLIWFEDGRYEYGPPRRALEQAFYTPNPVRARFVLWAENHFSTWLRKAEGDRKWQEHIEFSRLGVAPFRDLLLASSRSPAMLRYLDQDQSFAGRLNENYAREIMELHSLGVNGGYTQADVTNLAGLLTGWTASTLGGGGGGSPRGFKFRFDPQVSSGAATRVVGVEYPETGRADRYDRALRAIETLAAHPSTARFIATELCEAYASVPAPEALVDELALVFERTDGDVGAMLIAMSEHPAFWQATRARRVCTPLDYALRLARGTGYHQPWRIGEYLQLAGFQVFDRSTPDGYPTEDSAYSDSNALIQRWSLAQDASGAILNQIPDPWRWEGLTPDRAWAQKVVDAAAVRLTGRVLGESSNEAAIDLLLSSDRPVPQRVQMIAPVIAQMPEANLK